MGNGFPIAALAGRRELMELGGLRTNRPRVFLLSSTHGAESATLAASTPRRTWSASWSGRGAALASGINASATAAGIGQYLSVVGRPSCQVFRTADASGSPSQAMRTLFLQEILLRGGLGQSFVVSAAHTDADVELTVEAARGRWWRTRKALELGRPEDLFAGRPVAPAHRRYAHRRQLLET